MPMESTEARPLFRADRERLQRHEEALATEWLETDGVGGYAASTLLACPTRRYHGLLVALPEGSARRHVFLARFEEHVRRGGEALPISCARYAGTFAPAGHAALEEFALRPWPSALYRLGRTRVRREVLCVKGARTVLCRYAFEGPPGPLELELRPQLAFREADALTFENGALDPRYERLPDGISVRPYDALPALHIAVSGGALSVGGEGAWTRGLEYGADLARGYGGHEDQFSPCALVVASDGTGEVVVAATLDPLPAPPAELWQRESARRRARAEAASAQGDPLRARCDLAADDFLYRAPDGRLGVIAGFPWFGEWGRDTFLSIPGLTLARGRLDECAEVLSAAAGFLRNGLVPNVYGATPEDSDYGSLDASLWFARAVGLWSAAGGARERLLEEYAPALVAIAEAYRSGTAPGTGADASELVRTGDGRSNPTWMDARVGDESITPRGGFAVETSALWCSLLRQLEELLAERGERRAAATWATRRKSAERAFVERFWLPEAGTLADRWVDGRPDPSVRPNMVLAAALPRVPLTRGQRAAVVARARRDLLTPRGLRTLAPDDPAYVGRYEGGPEQRDRAYHQGTAWPWLLGSYVEASLRAAGDDADEGLRRELRALLDDLGAEHERAGLGHVSEVFDGDPPQRPGGSFAQAWNTAELLRALELLGGDGRCAS